MQRTKQRPRRSAPVEEKGLNPGELHALAKAVSKTQLDTARSRLRPGATHAVDFTVRVSGVVLVGPNGQTTRREIAPADKLLATVLSALDSRSRSTVIEAVRDAFANYASAAEVPEPDEEAIRLADELMPVLTHEAKEPRRGSVSAAVEVKVLKRG